MGGSDPPPVYTPPPPTPPDPFKTAEAQQGYNVNSAVAQSQLNNVNQITPYGDITYTQTGGSYVGGQPAVADTPATGGYWNGQMWVPTGGSTGHAATQGQWVPTYTATTKLNPELQGVVDKGLINANTSAAFEGNLLKNAQEKLTHPLDLSWGNIASNIYGLEKNTLDPQWAHDQEVKDQQLANQGLTPGSQGWGYEQTQFGLNKANAYDKAMLDAQGQAVQDITAEYNSPINMLNALRSGAQVQQPGVGQTAQTSPSQVGAANYAGIASNNYAVGSQNFNSAQQAQQAQYQAQQQHQDALLGGLFGLGGKALGALGGLI